MGIQLNLFTKIPGCLGLVLHDEAERLEEPQAGP